MKKENRRNVCSAAGLLTAFLLWTAAVGTVDVEAIGPQGSSVGLATVNRFVHTLTGVHMALYTLTDWLALVPAALAAGFALLGLVQWIGRKYLWRVDRDLLILGGFYAAVAALYVLFEALAVNARPVLIGGVLETSYPSSTTMLVLCVVPTAVMQFNARIGSGRLKRLIAFAGIAFTVFMVTARMVSGVHWFTDIIGGGLLSAGLVMLYRAVIHMEA